MVDGRQLAPGVELGHALGHAPPHAARAGEVVAGRRVVDATLLRGGDAALERAHLLGHVEVRARQLLDGTLRRLLHPPLEGVGADQPVLGRRLQVRDGIRHRGARQHLLRDGLLLAHHAVELLEPPVVRLLQVDGRAEEPARRQRVAVAPAGVALAGGRQQLLGEEVGECPVRRAGPCSAVLQVGAQGRRHVARRRRGAREVVEEATGARLAAGLLGHLQHLATGGCVVRADARAQRLDVPGQRARHVGEPSGHVGEVVDAVGGHEVEHVAHVLHGRGDDVEVLAPGAGLVLLQLQVEGAHQLGVGDDVDRVDGLHVLEATAHRPRRLGERGVAVGGVVGVLALAPGPTEVHVHLGSVLEHRVEPLLGEGVDGGRGAGLSHGGPSSSGGRPAGAAEPAPAPRADG